MAGDANNSSGETTNNSNKDLSVDDRLQIVASLLQQSKDLKLKCGIITNTAEQWNVSVNTVRRLWRAASQSLNETGKLPDFASKRIGKCGRKKSTIDIDARIRTVPWSQRRNLRSLSAAIQVPKSVLFRALTCGQIVRHSNAIKPHLTEENKAARLDFCLSFVDPDNYAFQSLDNRVFIDEKWFYLSKEEQTFYIAPGETPPHRSAQSKRFVTKVMFMAAVMRPVVDENGIVLFDGKLGVWPFVEHGVARRSSRNRLAGTAETKCVTVGREEQRTMLIENVIPAIKAKVPALMRQSPIVIQQDGARCHVQYDDPLIVQACMDGGWDIKFETQPPNSPDLNILDLGFFCSIQSLQHQHCLRTIDDLIRCTQLAFHSLHWMTLDSTFLSLQQVMESVIKGFGDNRYKRPHMGKEKLRRAGLLPKNYSCDELSYLLGYAHQMLCNAELAERAELQHLRAAACHS